MADNSVDAVVTDPPYGLSFMGKKWDYDVPSAEVWAECLRVLKPGGHLLAFAGTRTQHRMAVRIEDAGFEIRDMIAWVYGSGFPKSLDVSKAIDKAAGAEREVLGTETRYNEASGIVSAGRDERTLIERKITAPATDAARQWAGWGTALKPALEPITVARKPLAGTVAENVLAHGTGAVNVDGCRVGASKNVPASVSRKAHANCYMGGWGEYGETPGVGGHDPNLGRWPANLIHDGSDEVVGLFPQAKSYGDYKPSDARSMEHNVYGGWSNGKAQGPVYSDTGSAARFFKSCPQDEICPLCCLPTCEAFNTLEAWKNILARNAENSGWTSQATVEFIARLSAIGSQSERLAPHVRSAGNLCGSCAMSIAVALVGTKTSAFSSAELQVTLASTGSFANSTLIHNLVSFVELWESIDTIPTIRSLSLLFGSVHHAIGNSTKPESKGRAAEGSGPEGATRFVYNAKASKADRDEGCEGLEAKEAKVTGMQSDQGMPMRMEKGIATGPKAPPKLLRNHHPTVKPTALMRYLCRLVTPPGGTVLDPFTGSGSTGKAAKLEGFNFIGIEREAEYVEIARARIAAVPTEPPTLFS